MQPSPIGETSKLLFPSLRFCIVSPSKPFRFSFQRSHVDDEAVLHVALGEALVGFVDLLDADQLDVGGDAVLGAEIKHLLRFADAADGGTGQPPPLEQQAEGGE